MKAHLTTDFELDLAVQIAEGLAEAIAPSLTISAAEWTTWFEQWLRQLYPDLPETWQHSAYDMALRLTDDAEVQALNAQYRQKDEPTDVLSFAALEVESPEIPDADFPLELGDIIISLPTAQRQANQQGHSLRTELAWLAAHGLLHLLSWDHPDDESLHRMLQQQVLLLGTVGVEAPRFDVSESA